MRGIRTASALAVVATAGLALTGCSIFGNEDSVFSLEVGDCLNVSDLGNQVQNIPTIDCSKPHEGEAYASTKLDDGDFPGEEAVTTKAEAFCTGEFQGFVGTAYDESEVYAYFLTPSSDSWGQGDREVVCIAYLDGDTTTGTLKGSGR